VLGAAKGAGGRILGVIKTIQEKLESGETIAKIGWSIKTTSRPDWPSG